MNRIQELNVDALDLGAASVETKGTPGIPVEADDLGNAAELSD
jgi:hypothetical protein